MGRVIRAGATAAILFAVIGTASAQPIELQWWHAMTAANAKVVNQSEYRVVPVFKGTYAKTMNAGIAAYRAGKPPHIIQIFEVATATMMTAKGAVMPVYQLMKEAGEPFDPNAYLPAVNRLLQHRQRQDAVIAIQQFDCDYLLEQNTVQEGRPRRRCQARQRFARAIRAEHAVVVT